MLHFHFNNNRPIYLQLIEQLELYIISGKIPPGSKLPPVRDLAAQAQVNTNTMQRALSELEDLRLVYTERTNGKYVTDNLHLIKKRREKFVLEKVQKFLFEMHALGIDQQTIIECFINQGGKHP